MKILMMTNTFSPHVGGVARSIERFCESYRQLGHHVKVVAPEFDHMPEYEPDVIRIPAVRNFNHTDFSVSMPVPLNLDNEVDAFEPDIIHSHHPFLVGGTALRVAHTRRLPLVFTHHTKYEDYTHNVPGDSPTLKRFVQSLATQYSNACDQVFSPSESMARILLERGVTTPVNVVPTGLDVDVFGSGDGMRIRKRMGIPSDAFVVGHLGRLTVEKNIPFLIQSVVEFLENADTELNACFAVFGSGPLSSRINDMFKQYGLADRLYLAGVIDSEELADVYQAMNVFAFSSLSETQGMVLTEAMAAGVPVVAVDAPGVREVVMDGKNGCLLPECDHLKFACALDWICQRMPDEYQELVEASRQTAQEFSMHRTAQRALELYSRLVDFDAKHRHNEYPMYVDALTLFESEWQLLKNTVTALSDSLSDSLVK